MTVKPKTPTHILLKMAKTRGLLDQELTQPATNEQPISQETQPPLATPSSNDMSMMMEWFKMMGNIMKEWFENMWKLIQENSWSSEPVEQKKPNADEYFNLLWQEPKKPLLRTYFVEVKDDAWDVFLDLSSTTMKTRESKKELEEYIAKNNMRNCKIVPVN